MSAETSESRKRRAAKNLVKVVVAGAVVAACCYWAWTQLGASSSSKAKDESVVAAEEEATTTEEKRTGATAETLPGGGGARPAQKSKKDVKAILEEVVSVQKTMMKVMDETIDVLVKNDISLRQVYEKIEAAQVQDPLEKNGLSISEFDELLVRFSTDEEVNHLVNEVVQGPDNAFVGDRMSVTDLRRDFAELTVDRVITLNEAMKGCLSDVVKEIATLKPTIPNFSPRVASLAAQAMVGAFIKKQFGISADEVEKAMMLHQYELSQRSEFLLVNEEITNLMNSLK